MSAVPGADGDGRGLRAPWGDQAVFDALAATFLALSSAMAGGADAAGSRFGRSPEGAWACAPVDIPDVNRVLVPRLAGPEAAVEAGIEALEGRFGGRPHTWWLDPGATPAGLAEAVRWVAAPIREAAVPVMALDLAAWRPAPARPGVSVELAASAADLVAAETLCAVGFGAVEHEAEPFGSLFAGVAMRPGGPLVVGVASIAGRAAATALGIVAGDVVGVYNVATLPDARRRGLGRAAMDAVLVAARGRGAGRAVLESSPEGLGLYRGMGFRAAGAALVLTVVPERA